MSTPRHWFTAPDRPGLLPRLLAPLGAACAAATAHRLARGTRRRVAVPVICVGSLDAGGTGKTLAVIALVLLLQRMGIAPHVLSRGHRGAPAGAVRVDPTHHGASDFGDGPMLTAAFAPTWVAHDRAAGARAAADAGAQTIVMYDGFQDPTLLQDLAIVVADARRGFGNGRCIPAGPLREPVATGLARSDLLLTIGAANEQKLFDTAWDVAVRLPRLRAALRPMPTGMGWQGTRLLAFAGIEQPDRFFATLRGLGADLARTKALDDNRPLTPALMKRLASEASGIGAQLVTTEKDAVRLPPGFRSRVLTLPVRLEFDDEAPLLAALAGIGLVPRQKA